MHDLPPETVDEEPLVPYIEEAQVHSPALILDDLEFEIEEVPSHLPPLQTKRATRSDLFRLAHFLHDEYQNEITWKDYASMIGSSIDFLQNCTEMSIIEKRKAILITLDYVIAQTDVPFLPVGTFEPIFESLIIPFTDFALETRSGRLIFHTERAQVITPFREATPSSERLESFAKGILRLWESGFHWHDFAKAARISIAFLLTFEEVSRAELRSGTTDIITMLINASDQSLLPEDFNQKIFESFIVPFSEVIIPLEKANGSI